jgi:hypothetical protein
MYFFVTQVRWVVSDSSKASWVIAVSSIRGDFVTLSRLGQGFGGLEQRHSCYQAVYKSDTIHFCYFSFIISGVPKCGTSAVFKWLSSSSTLPSSRIVLDGGGTKEACPRVDSVSELWNFFTFLNNRTHHALKLQKEGNEVLMFSGCIINKQNLLMKWLLREERTKYVLMTRDFADMLWAGYNFWCTELYDGDRCDQKHWANASLHYRSNEMFHLLMSIKADGYYVVSPLDKQFNFSITTNNFFQSYMDQFTSYHVASADVLFLASEEMHVDTTSFLDKFTGFIGISKSALDPAMVKKLVSTKVNTNNNKGTTAVTHNQVTSGLYEISKFQPLLSTTRELLYRSWRSDCLWVSNRTGFEYPACHS